MKRIFSILALLFMAFTLGAQTRTYTDNASKTFIVGLDSYFYGNSGSLDFRAGGSSWQAVVNGPKVDVGGTVLDDGNGEVVVGVHDFTGDRDFELVVARKDGDVLTATVYTLSSGEWARIGRVGLSGGEAQDFRVFRQVVSVRDHSTGILHSWTFHAGRFDYRGSDGGSDPTPAE